MAPERKVTLSIASCRECPQSKEGPSYSLDGWDRGNDWFCSLANGKEIAGFVERRSEKIGIPDWCPLLKKKASKRHG